MSTDFTIRKGDTAPVFDTTLKDPDGNPPDLTGATIVFSMRDQFTGTHLITGSCTIVGSPTLGQISYAWTPTDTAIPGWYYALFTVTYSNGKIESYPNDHFMTVLVTSSV